MRRRREESTKEGGKGDAARKKENVKDQAIFKNQKSRLPNTVSSRKTSLILFPKPFNLHVFKYDLKTRHLIEVIFHSAVVLYREKELHFQFKFTVDFIDNV